MKLMTKNTDYAIVALLALATSPDKAMSAARLSSELGIRYPFLRRILQKLAANGLIVSRRGIGGGFLLLREPSKISVCDVVEIFQGPVALQSCRSGKASCERTARCAFRNQLNELELALIAGLKGMTLESLAGGTVNCA